LSGASRYNLRPWVVGDAMFLRVLFLLLLAGNVGLAAWLWLAPVPPPDPPPPTTDPGVPRLVLLSETEPAHPEVDAAELATEPRTVAEEAQDTCIRLGPFVTQSDLRRALTALTPKVKRIQFKEDRQRQSRGYLVYLPAPASREEALKMARRLSTKGVRDYYVVTAGEDQNSISLGLFKERANADKRRGDLETLGFEPQVIERSDELPIYWLDYALDAGTTLNWRALLPDLLDVTEQQDACG